MSEHDIDVLKSILNYIEQIDEANRQFNMKRGNFENNSVYRNAVAMCVLQIGEMVKHLSDEYKLQTNSSVPWHQIQGLRNIVAHNYGRIDSESLWETITDDVPKLRTFCYEQISLDEKMEAENIPDIRM